MRHTCRDRPNGGAPLHVAFDAKHAQWWWHCRCCDWGGACPDWKSALGHAYLHAAAVAATSLDDRRRKDVVA